MRISDWSSDVCSSDLGQCNLRGISHGVMDGVARLERPRFAPVSSAGVKVALEAGKVARRYLQPDPMPGREPVARDHRPKLDRVDFTGRHKPWFVIAFAIARDRKSTRLNSSH